MQRLPVTRRRSPMRRLAAVNPSPVHPVPHAPHPAAPYLRRENGVKSVWVSKVSTPSAFFSLAQAQ